MDIRWIYQHELIQLLQHEQVDSELIDKQAKNIHKDFPTITGILVFVTCDTYSK